MELTEDKKKFIRQNFKTMLYSEIAAKLGLTERQIRAYLLRNNLRLPAKELKRRIRLGAFKKGDTPWNKGLKFPNQKPNSGQYKKGNVPFNAKYDGFIQLRTNKKRVNNDYYYIRLASNKWQELHRYIWEQANGPIPKNCVIKFIDGNHHNCCLSNLEMITKAKHVRMNCRFNPDRQSYDKIIAGYITKDDDLKKELLNHPEILELKRQQLKLEREINDFRKQA